MRRNFERYGTTGQSRVLIAAALSVVFVATSVLSASAEPPRDPSGVQLLSVETLRIRHVIARQESDAGHLVQIDRMTRRIVGVIPAEAAGSGEVGTVGAAVFHVGVIREVRISHTGVGTGVSGRSPAVPQVSLTPVSFRTPAYHDSHRTADRGMLRFGDRLAGPLLADHIPASSFSTADSPSCLAGCAPRAQYRPTIEGTDRFHPSKANGSLRVGWTWLSDVFNGRD